jgi:aryl-alcohol dehydrogenase-like predicted oxidoreductase
MELRKIGSLEVSLVGLGCNNFGGRIDESQTKAVVNAALDAGIILFDTADSYGGGLSEEYLGRALGSRRDEAVIATKFGMGDPGGASAATIQTAVENSLRRLGTDRIDLYQLHAPDNGVPIEETLGALDGLVRDGKVRQIGCSNFDARLIDEAAAAADKHGTAPFRCVQNELSVLRRRGQSEVFDACDRQGLSFLPYFPLASGLLTGKYHRGEPPPAGTRLAGLPAERQEKALSDKRFDVVESLSAFASERGHSVLELAMSWLAGLPQVASVIAGATKPEQVAANAAAVGWAMTADERARIDELSPE